MNSVLNPLFQISHVKLILIISLVLFIPPVNGDSPYGFLIFSKCSNRTYATASSDFHSRILTSLFHELLSESGRSKFFKTTAGDERIGISGLFQCRGDLGNGDCHDCVRTLLAQVSQTTMCKQAVKVRVQLDGCYLQYQTDGFIEETREHELLHESCSEKKAEEGRFTATRDAGFLAMMSEEIGENGFYESDYEYLHVIAQCEGDLKGCHCSECVRNAAGIAQEDCGNSVSGKVYLESCFVSYAYYPKGTPGKLYPDEEEDGHGGKRGKTVAIALGAACHGRSHYRLPKRHAY